MVVRDISIRPGVFRMPSFKRISLVLLTSTAALSLAGCGGADSVASPGDGVIVAHLKFSGGLRE